MSRFFIEVLVVSFLAVFVSSSMLTAQKADQIQTLSLQTDNSGESDLFVDEDGIFYLSWIEYLDDTTDVLQFAVLKDITEGWSPPKVIATGSDWFVNWADFPAILGSDDGQHIASHWLQKSADGTYDYDVKISQSHDGGETWSAPMTPHKDHIQAEHGFVSMAYTPAGNIFLTWLDGRNTKKETNNAMTLRSAELTREGKLLHESELDNRVCDCCQTSSTYAKDGPIVVYRDRSEDEIRDIGIINSKSGEWQATRKLHDDHWKIAGCPVNGPAIDNSEKTVVVAWYTMDNEGNTKVNVVFSTDQGDSFSAPVRVDQGAALGRVDVVVVDAHTALVSWMEDGKDTASIMLREVTADGKMAAAVKVSENASNRSSGFPRMAYHKGELVISYTAASDEDHKQVKTILISL